jgi:tetratricopeptide (TPR) repeat protein
VLTVGFVLVALLSGVPADAPDEASQFLRRGNEAFLDGRLDDAIREYNRGYQLFPSPNLLYNLGQAYRAAGRKREALDAFRKVIREVEEGPARDLANRLASARAWAAALEAELSAAAPAPAAPPKEEPDTPPARTAAAAASGKVAKSPAAGITGVRLTPPRNINDLGITATAVPPPNQRPHKRWVWWAIGLGAAVTAVASVFVVSSLGHQSSCPSSADLGCF